MIKIAICDDNKDDRKKLLADLIPYLDLSCKAYSITEFSDGYALLNAIEEKQSFNIVFLDIFMPKIKGIKVAREIRSLGEDKIKIVFVTTSKEYALDGYDVYASGYIVKPINRVLLLELVERIVNFEFAEENKNIVIKTDKGMEKVFIDDIVFIESGGRKVKLHKKNKAIIEFYAKLDVVENEISSKIFLRCHQSYLVNMSQISTLSKSFSTLQGFVIPIRKNGAKEVKEAYCNYLLSQTNNKQ